MLPFTKSSTVVTSLLPKENFGPNISILCLGVSTNAPIDIQEFPLDGASSIKVFS